MSLTEIADQIREARLKKRLTQQELADRAGLSRSIVNQIERGTRTEIGMSRLSELLRILDLQISVVPLAKKDQPDFLRMACISASTSYRRRLTVAQLRRALLTGKIPPRREPHFRVILEELPRPVLEGVIATAGGRENTSRVRQNLASIARQIGSPGQDAA